MRLCAHIAAFLIILTVGYVMVSSGYSVFLRATHSQLSAQGMVLFMLIFTTLSMIWAVRRLP